MHSGFMHTVWTLLCSIMMWQQSISFVSFKVHSLTLGNTAALVLMKQPWKSKRINWIDQDNTRAARFINVNPNMDK